MERVVALPADASFRRYFRVNKADGNSVLLMDAPPDREDVHPYVHISQHIASLGLSAPRILAHDIKNGFLLIEDFGDNTFTRLLNKGMLEGALYSAAIDVLANLHTNPRSTDIDLSPYGADELLEEALLFTDWFWPEKYGSPCPSSVREEYALAWQTVFESMPKSPRALVLRDYHVDNLMLLSERKGVAACGLLDFQDARIGPAAYDLVSLLEDARRDVSPELAQAMKIKYCSEVGLNWRGKFKLWYAVLGTQRHAKVAGIFVRLYRRDGKAQYLGHLPRVMNLFSSHLSEPVLSPVRNWVNTYMPDYLDPLLGDPRRKGALHHG
jgi:aminoglycoside/choline kinase family phosphotransferase